MKPLELTLMPCPRSGDGENSAERNSHSFVDDEVVMALVNGPVSRRAQGSRDDLALVADECDFAGWNLGGVVPPVTRAASSTPQEKADDACRRRATPPSWDEPGIGEPHRGEHRWWVAGLVGALSTILFSAVLFSLSTRAVPLSEELIFIRPADRPTPQPAAAEVRPKEGPALTGIAADR